MYDLHTHTILSDGALIASELVRRYSVRGGKGVVITDHVDSSNIDIIIPQIVKFCHETRTAFKPIHVLPGCELTHIPLGTFSNMIARARSLGAKVIIVHGETIVEPVVKGANKEGILSGADIIAHPGLIKEEDVILAKEHNVSLEITSRHGHSYTNAYVAELAKKHGVNLVFSTDFHEPRDFVTVEMQENILRGAGLTIDEIKQVLLYTEKFFKSKLEVK
ncbi:MAG: histidinol phosphate phosphatase domain-containing protein [Candidatus Omnitrophota bacterium]